MSAQEWSDKTEPMTDHPEFSDEPTAVSQHPESSSDSDQPSTKSAKTALLLAEFATPESVLAAAEKVRDAGFQRWDVHTPYPVHGMDDAMGLKGTKLGVISFVAGITGCLGAVVMIQWMNAYDYPLIVGGKPPGAVPSMIPIMFEMSILLTGFATIFGLLHFTRLPRHHHPIFASRRFATVSDDRFFISIEAADPRFDESRTKTFLQDLKPVALERVGEET